MPLPNGSLWRTVYELADRFHILDVDEIWALPYHKLEQWLLFFQLKDDEQAAQQQRRAQ